MFFNLIWEEVVMLELHFIFQDSLCDNMLTLHRFKKNLKFFGLGFKWNHLVNKAGDFMLLRGPWKGSFVFL